MIIKFSQLVQFRKSLRNKKIVFAGGAFDLVHRGHIEFFKRLKKFGDVVIVAVSSDKRVRQEKGPGRPILSEKQRLAIVDSMRHVNYALIAPRPAKNKPVPTIRILSRLKPNIFVTIDKRWDSFRNDIKLCGTKLKILPSRRINSTTRIINKILKRYCSKENKMSGR